MKLLTFITMTNSGDAREVSFPLHPETGSTEELSTLVTELLNTISNHLEKCQHPKNGDILQALTMVSAIRCGLVEVNSNVSKELFCDLFESNFDAFLKAKPTICGTA